MFNDYLADANHDALAELQCATARNTANQLIELTQALHRQVRQDNPPVLEQHQCYQLGRLLARLLGNTSTHATKTIALISGLTDQIHTQIAQCSLTNFCSRAWVVPTGHSFDELCQALHENNQAAYIDRDVTPDNFPFSTAEEKRLDPISLLTVIEPCRASDVLSMLIESHHYTLPDLAHALSFTIRYPHITEESPVLVPCTPWQNPQTGPLTLIVYGKKQGQITSRIDTCTLDYPVNAEGPLIMAVGKNRYASTIPSDAGGYPDSPRSY